MNNWEIMVCCKTPFSCMLWLLAFFSGARSIHLTLPCQKILQSISAEILVPKSEKENILTFMCKKSCISSL